MRIYWQSFVDANTAGAYLETLQSYLNGIAAAGTQVEVFGMAPPDRDFGRLSELRCGIQAIDAGIGAEEAGYDCFVMGHFQDPCLYDLRATLSMPVVGAGEATLLAASQLGRRIGLVTLDPAFEVIHREQADLYGLGSRISHVTGLGLTPADFNACFAGDDSKRANLLQGFSECAMPMVQGGADVIVPAGILPGLLIGGEPGYKVGAAPVVNCAAVALKSAEMWVQLRALSDLEPNRGTSFVKANERAKRDFRTLIAHGQSALGSK
ncbi:aspartate/glutamate racemase family protein [uncultured Sulfitobacter sp.]|uniref:aspartate/glutamate racemase family protein n=1 Tax=uncultured Sulfitobacter sp. TaxID=191468 RepID=UPI00261C962C|nr:aspartate/glutamate racemase family protein [uncultured Sulfitobacter sp.]